MKFVIEGLGLTSGGGKAGLMRLLPALAKQGHNHTFRAVLADRAEFGTLAGPNLKLVRTEKPASLLTRHLHLQRTIPRICAEQSADALLCLGNFGPQHTPLPTVVLLHNAHYVSEGSSATALPSVRERMIASYARHYLRRLPQGVQLVVQTDVMKARLTATHHIPASRVTVIREGDGLPPASSGLGYGQEKSATNPSDGVAIPGLTSSSASGVKPFTFLCVARYYPHKNLEVLLDAMKRLPVYTRRAARCVITVDQDQHPAARKLLRRIASEHMEQLVMNAGPLDGSEVIAAYQTADAFILPTTIESFGRTYLEATRFNLPILTSDRDFAREVCRGAAVYFDPLDPDCIARSMAQVINDSGLRQRLSTERQRITVPSWDDVADQFLDLLQAIAARRTSPSLRCPVPDCAPWPLPRLRRYAIGAEE